MGHYSIEHHLYGHQTFRKPSFHLRFCQANAKEKRRNPKKITTLSKLCSIFLKFVLKMIFNGFILYLRISLEHLLRRKKCMIQEKTETFEKVVMRDYGNIAGIVVLKNGETLYENYFNGCTINSRIHVYSVTKSIISILIGIAMDKGYIKNLDQKVLDFFPEYKIKKREKTIQNITLRHLLTMTAPYKYKFNPYIKYFTSDNWVKFSLDLLGGKG